MGARHLYTSAGGVLHTWEDAGDHKIIKSYQAVDPILDRNQAMYTHNDGYTPSREMRRAASIPLALIMKWRQEEGWDPFSSDPDCQKKLAQKLNDHGYLKLRTAPGVL